MRVLMVEDSADDAELTLDVLREGGFDVDCLRVETAEAMQDALAGGNWNVVLSDYHLPCFSGDAALSVLKASGLDIPFIIVSGCIGEEAAVGLLKVGAHDFVIKGSAARLVPAVQRGLLEAETRRQFQHAQADLEQSEARFRAIASNLPGMVFQFLRQVDGAILFPYVSDGSRALLGLDPPALQDTPALFMDLIAPEDKASYDQSMVGSATNLAPWNWEGRIMRGAEQQDTNHQSPIANHQDITWISLRASPRRTSRGEVMWDGIMADITQNKLADIELKRSREKLAELSSYLQQVKEEERAKIAREIHDDIGGMLTAIKCDTLWCTSATPRDPKFCREKAAAIDSLVDSVIDSTRRIAMDLRPSILDCGIVAAVRWQAKEFHAHSAIPCQVSCDPDEIQLDAERSVAIFRIFQETLTNISKHAKALEIRVTLAEAGGWVVLEVADDGRGITDHDMAKPKSFGIHGMRERCHHLGGTLCFASTPGKGTRVTIRIPVNPAQKQQAVQPATARKAAAIRPRVGARRIAEQMKSSPEALQQWEDSDDTGVDCR